LGRHGAGATRTGRAARWDDLPRLATSIRRGTLTASAMLRELTSYSWQNGLGRRPARNRTGRTLDLHAHA